MLRRLLLICFFCLLVPVAFGGFHSLERAAGREAVLERWETEILRLKEEWMIPGMSVGVIYGNETIFQQAYGVKDLSIMEPVDIFTLFQVGSTTKAFTSALAAMFVDEGHFDWNDRVVDLHPDFRLRDRFAQENFLVKDLMAQRSGLYPCAEDILVMWGFDREKLIESLPFHATKYSFRSEFSYVNNLFLIVEDLLTQFSGNSYAELLQERIFDPLGMVDTTGTLEDFLSGDNIVTTYMYREGRLLAIDPDDPFITRVNAVFPAGGICSNIPDMLRWVNFHLNLGSVNGTELISREALLFTHTPQTIMRGNSVEPVAAYCQGWIHEEFEGQKLIWHNGDSAGCHVMVLMIPETQLGVVVFSNVGGHGVPDALAKAFVQIALGNPPTVLESLHFPDLKDDPVDVVYYPPLPLQEYEGIYYNEMLEEVHIRTEDSVLKGKVTGGRRVLEFEHITRDVFTVHIPPYLFDISLVSFKIDAHGGVEGFFLWEENSPEAYWFEAQ